MILKIPLIILNKLSKIHNNKFKLKIKIKNNYSKEINKHKELILINFYNYKKKN